MIARKALPADGQTSREHQCHRPIAMAFGLQLDESRRIETATRQTGIESRLTERPGSPDGTTDRRSNDTLIRSTQGMAGVSSTVRKRR